MPQDRLPNCNRGMQRILRIRPRATRREQTRRSWIFVRTIELDFEQLFRLRSIRASFQAQSYW